MGAGVHLDGTVAGGLVSLPLEAGQHAGGWRTALWSARKREMVPRLPSAQAAIGCARTGCEALRGGRGARERGGLATDGGGILFLCTGAVPMLCAADMMALTAGDNGEQRRARAGEGGCGSKGRFLSSSFCRGVRFRIQNKQ